MFTTEGTERTEFKKKGFLSDLGELSGYKKRLTAVFTN